MTVNRPTVKVSRQPI